MKIKLNKEYTTARYTDIVKDAMRDFKQCFTENDLLQMFEENFGNISALTQRKVIETTVEAFSSNGITDDVSFLIEMLVKIPYFEYHELRFYLDCQDGNYIISSDPILHEDRIFKFQ